MANSFNLSDFFPEPITFADTGFGGDGKVHDVKTPEFLGMSDIVKMQRLFARVQGINANTKRTEEQSAAMLEKAVDEMMETLIPTLHKARLAKIPFSVKFKFLNWWKKEQDKEVPADTEGEVEAGES